MADPVDDAVHRAWGEFPNGQWCSREELMQAAAREALKPIRDWFETRGYRDTNDLIPLIYNIEGMS